MARLPKNVFHSSPSSLSRTCALAFSEDCSRSFRCRPTAPPPTWSDRTEEASRIDSDTSTSSNKHCVTCVSSSLSVCAGQQAPATHLCRPRSGRQDLRLFPVSTEVLFPDRVTGRTSFYLRVDIDLIFPSVYCSR